MAARQQTNANKGSGRKKPARQQTILSLRFVKRFSDDKNMLVRPKQEIGQLARHLDEVRVETKSRTFFEPSDVTRTHLHLRRRRAAVAHPPKAIMLRLKYACLRVPWDGSQIYYNTRTLSLSLSLFLMHTPHTLTRTYSLSQSSDRTQLRAERKICLLPFHLSLL